MMRTKHAVSEMRVRDGDCMRVVRRPARHTVVPCITGGDAPLPLSCWRCLLTSLCYLARWVRADRVAARLHDAMPTQADTPAGWCSIQKTLRPSMSRCRKWWE